MTQHIVPFTGPNANSLTAGGFTWTTIGTQVLGITNNMAAVQVDGLVQGAARLEADVATVDQLIEAPLSLWTVQANGICQLGLCLRHSDLANTKYELLVNDVAVESNFLLQIRKWTAGSNASLAQAVYNAVQGDLIRFEVETNGANAVLRGYVNDALIVSHTDSSSPITTGKRCGLTGRRLVSGDAAAITSLTFRDLFPGIPTPSSLNLLGVGV